GGRADKRRERLIKREQKRILRLTAAGGFEETERRVVTQSVVDGKVSPDAPGIFGVEAETLHILREAAVACGRRSACCSGGDVCRRHGRTCSKVVRELLRVSSVVAGIKDERN